jgi:hypothetical protein
MRRWLGFALAVCLLASFWGASEARVNPRYLNGGETPKLSETMQEYEYINDLSIGALWFPNIAKKGYIGYYDISGYYPGGGDQSLVWQAGMYSAGYVERAGGGFYDNAFQYLGSDGHSSDPYRYDTLGEAPIIETEADYDLPYPYRKITIHVNTNDKPVNDTETDGDVGLDVTYEWHAWGVRGYDDFVIVHCTVLFQKDIEDFYWGWMSDCDCGDVNLPDYYFDDYAGWDEDLYFCYMRDWDYDPLNPQPAAETTSDSLFLTPNAVGQVLLAAPPVGGPVTAAPDPAQEWVSQNYWDWNNDVTGAQSVYDRLAGIWENPFPPEDDFDYRILNGVGPYDITAGQVGHFWMAYVLGEGYDDDEHGTFDMGNLKEHVQAAIDFYEGGLVIPEEDYPPRAPDLNPDLDADVVADQLTVHWSPYTNIPSPGAQADGFNVYTSNISKLGPWELLESFGPSTTQTVITLPPGFYTYVWVEALDDDTGNGSNPFALTSRIWERDSRDRLRANENTIVGVIGSTPAESDVENVTVAPNPYIGTNAAELTEYETLLGFHYLPEKCEIYIYTLLGNLVDIIHHDSQSGSEFWDMTTRTQEAISSGLYVYRVVSDSGDEKIGKFAVIKGQR